jgi:uncharacterized protein (DUF2164 family)
MALVEFGRDEKAELVRRLQRWCAEEIDTELGGFDAEFLLDFVVAEIGPQIYNRAVQDAIAALDGPLEGMKDVLWALEKPPGD